MATTKLGFGDIQATLSGDRATTAAEKVSLQAQLIPSYTTTQRDALTSPYPRIIYNSTTNKLNVRVAAGWEAITSA